MKVILNGVAERMIDERTFRFYLKKPLNCSCFWKSVYRGELPSPDATIFKSRPLWKVETAQPYLREKELTFLPDGVSRSV